MQRGTKDSQIANILVQDWCISLKKKKSFNWFSHWIIHKPVIVTSSFLRLKVSSFPFPLKFNPSPSTWMNYPKSDILPAMVLKSYFKSLSASSNPARSTTSFPTFCEKLFSEKTQHPAATLQLRNSNSDLSPAWHLVLQHYPFSHPAVRINLHLLLTQEIISRAPLIEMFQWRTDPADLLHFLGLENELSNPACYNLPSINAWETNLFSIYLFAYKY